jgi:hypothetical protein
MFGWALHAHALEYQTSYRDANQGQPCSAPVPYPVHRQQLTASTQKSSNVTAHHQEHEEKKKKSRGLYCTNSPQNLSVLKLKRVTESQAGSAEPR